MIPHNMVYAYTHTCMYLKLVTLSPIHAHTHACSVPFYDDYCRTHDHLSCVGACRKITMQQWPSTASMCPRPCSTFQRFHTITSVSSEFVIVTLQPASGKNLKPNNSLQQQTEFPGKMYGQTNTEFFSSQSNAHHLP